MSDNLVIEAEPRDVVGKKVKALRRDGIIPGVIYGQKDPVHVQMENLALRRVLRSASTTQLIDVKLKGKKYTVLAREIQQHATRGDLIHVDFMEVDMASTITASAELILVGKSPAAMDGIGSDVLPLHSIDIECLPGDLISEIEVDASRLETPDTVLYVSDLAAPKGVTILTDPETVVARFQYAAVEEEEPVEEFETSVEGVEIIGEAEEEEDIDEE